MFVPSIKFIFFHKGHLYNEQLDKNQLFIENNAYLFHAKLCQNFIIKYIVRQILILTLTDISLTIENTPFG